MPLAGVPLAMVNRRAEMRGRLEQLAEKVSQAAFFSRAWKGGSAGEMNLIDLSKGGDTSDTTKRNNYTRGWRVCESECRGSLGDRGW